MSNPEYIRTPVDGELRLVDFDLYLTVHQQLAEDFRARGLSGDALDVAIVEMLPVRLSKILDNTEVH